jgi:hypothetical protein
MDMVKNTISYCNFVSAWEETMIALGSQAELEEVHRWGIAEAEQLGMPLDRVGKLGDWPALPPAWEPGKPS